MAIDFLLPGEGNAGAPAGVAVALAAGPLGAATGGAATPGFRGAGLGGAAGAGGGLAARGAPAGGLAGGGEDGLAAAVGDFGTPCAGDAAPAPVEAGEAVGGLEGGSAGGGAGFGMTTPGGAASSTGAPQYSQYPASRLNGPLQKRQMIPPAAPETRRGGSSSSRSAAEVSGISRSRPSNLRPGEAGGCSLGLILGRSKTLLR